MDCKICYDGEVPKNFSCYCGFTTCDACFRTWITSDTSKEPSCPGCKRVFSQDYIYQTCVKTFVKSRYAVYRQAFLAAREKLYLVDDFEAVRSEKMRRNLRKQLLSGYKKKKSLLRKKMCVQEINARILDLKQELTGFLTLSTTNSKTPSTRKKNEYVLPCPDCRGFIRVSDHSCTLCETEVCGRCLMKKNAPHICREEDVVTANSILGNTKPCPRCAVRIHKISGCDQMWCVMCHCTFSWETGLETKSTVHNPHYFEWFYGDRRHRPDHEQPPGDCVDFIGYVQQQLLRDSFSKRPEYRLVTGLFRLIIHIDNVVLFDLTTDHRTNRDLRFRFLLEEIDDEDFGRLLYKREVRGLKKLAMRDLYQSLTTLLKDLLLGYLAETYDLKALLDAYLRVYDDAQKCAGDIVAGYGGRMKHVEEVERFHRWVTSFIRTYLGR